MRSLSLTCSAYSRTCSLYSRTCSVYSRISHNNLAKARTIASNTSPFNIRLASSRDNHKLVELSRKCLPVGQLVSYPYAPQFIEFSALQGDTVKVWLAEDENGQVAGCVALGTRDAKYRGQKVTHHYGFDLKVDPSVRRKQLGNQLKDHFLKEARKSGGGLAEIVIVSGNTKSINLAFRHFQSAGKLNLFQLLPIVKYRVDKKYKIRCAEQKDIPCIKNILERTYMSHSSAPLFEENYLERQFTKTPSFTIDNFKVAELDGQIVACAAFWDQTPLRAPVVVEVNGTFIKIQLKLLKLLSKIFNIAAPPEVGSMLRFQILRMPGVLDSSSKLHMEGLRSILHDESNRMKQHTDYQFLYAAFHEADSLANSICKMFKSKVETILGHAALDSEISLFQPAEAKKQPVYIDPSLL